MSTYLIRWKNGEKVLMEGDDIAEAFNLNGYTKEDIDAIDSYNEVILGDINHPDYPLADFCCDRCQGQLSVSKKVVRKSAVTQFDVYKYYCEECGNTYPEASNEFRAKIAMNVVNATCNIPTIGDINKLAKELLDANHFSDTED